MSNSRPVFSIEPPTPPESNTSSRMPTPTLTAGDVVVGLHTVESAAKMNNNGMRSRDSRESLIPERRKETWYSILAQVCIPFLIAGLGMVGAGLILDHVKEWKVFTEVPDLLVLVTPLLGLKGNLEMTLASRLSTHANLGHLKDVTNYWQICFGNLSLTQVQAIVVGFLAAVVAIFTGLMLPGEKEFNSQQALLLCASSMLTAAVASCILGVLMILVISLSKRFNLNPDNIATPIAASLGDVTTLGLLAWIASVLYDEMESKKWLAPVIIASYLVLTPAWAWVTYKIDFTKKVLINGWPPVLIAMLISSGGGLILDKAEERFPRLALFQPVINGVGGNLVSVQASRISTALHRDCQPGVLPGTLPGHSSPVFVAPCAIFCDNGVDSVAARVLLGIVIPGHIIFTTVTHFITYDSEYSFVFLVFYLTAALIQVAVLLVIAQNMINFLWKRKIDPDTSTIPYLTALGDLIGTALLFISFEIVSFIT